MSSITTTVDRKAYSRCYVMQKAIGVRVHPVPLEAKLVCGGANASVQQIAWVLHVSPRHVTYPAFSEIVDVVRSISAETLFYQSAMQNHDSPAVDDEGDRKIELVQQALR